MQVEGVREVGHRDRLIGIAEADKERGCAVD